MTFLALAAIVTAATLALAAVGWTIERLPTRRTSMRFEIRPPYILFHDNKPAEQVELRVNGVALPFHAHASSFSDAKKEYAWAFEGRPTEGATVMFTAKDRQVIGQVRGTSIVADAAKTPVTVASKPKQKK